MSLFTSSPHSDAGGFSEFPGIQRRVSKCIFIDLLRYLFQLFSKFRLLLEQPQQLVRRFNHYLDAHPAHLLFLALLLFVC
nr:MAG TPA: hypothetical protein [Caudoviricetes sp.]